MNKIEEKIEIRQRLHGFLAWDPQIPTVHNPDFDIFGHRHF